MLLKSSIMHRADQHQMYHQQAICSLCVAEPTVVCSLVNVSMNACRYTY